MGKPLRCSRGHLSYHKVHETNGLWCSWLMIKGEIHTELGERSTLLTTEMLHRQLLRKSFHWCWLHPVPWSGGTIINLQISSAAFVSRRGKIRWRRSTHLKFTLHTFEGFGLFSIIHRRFLIHFCFQGQISVQVSHIVQIVPSQRQRSQLFCWVSLK